MNCVNIRMHGATIKIKRLNLIFCCSNTEIVKLDMRVHFISSVAGVSEGLENNPSKFKGYLQNVSEHILSPKKRRTWFMLACMCSTAI